MQQIPGTVLTDCNPPLYAGYIVLHYQCIEWLWKIVLLALVASRGVTNVYP